MRVLLVRQRAETTARITAINNGITTLKANPNQYSAKHIPPGRWDTVNGVTGWYPFRLQNRYAASAPGVTVDTSGYATGNSFEAQYLIAMFNLRPLQDSNGNPELLDLGWGIIPGQTRANLPNGKIPLDANQTLTFFLTGIPSPLPTNPPSSSAYVFTGFSTDPTRPFLPPATASEPRLGPVLDLGGGGSNSKFAVDPTTGFARLIDAYGNPFAYFAPLNGVRNQNYGGCNTFILTGNPIPVAYSQNGLGQVFENADGFQLISAGKDGLFGSTGNWANVGPHGQDDQANFSPNTLGAGK